MAINKKSTKEKIKFLKVREVKSPQRAYEFDAGIDFFVPKFDAEFILDLKNANPHIYEVKYGSTGIAYNSATITFSGNTADSIVKYDLNDNNDTIVQFDEKKGKNYFLLSPHSRIMIPSGVKSRMTEPGRALIAANKSGVATKEGLIFGAQVVDYTYKGEIHLSVINTSTKNVRIYEDKKILQFVETPVFNSEVEIADGITNYDEEAKFYEGLQDDRGEGGFGSTDKEETNKK